MRIYQSHQLAKLCESCYELIVLHGHQFRSQLSTREPGAIFFQCGLRRDEVSVKRRSPAVHLVYYLIPGSFLLGHDEKETGIMLFCELGFLQVFSILTVPGTGVEVGLEGYSRAPKQRFGICGGPIANDAERPCIVDK